MKILALHGYTQSGPSFQCKVQRLHSHLEKHFPGAEFCFPTGPIRLRPSEKALGLGPQQYNADALAAAKNANNRPDPDDIDAYAWHTLHTTQDPPPGYQQSLDTLAEVLKREGPFDGILGFSQGTILAVMIASLLEGNPRREAFEHAQREYPDSFPFPGSYMHLDHPPLKFGITYGALMGVGKKYAWLYNKPLIQTPFLHFSGLYDPVVSDKMSRAVENARIGGDRAVRIVHPGAHNVCVGSKYLQAVVDFIKGVEDYSEPPTPEYSLPPEQQHTVSLPLDFLDWKLNGSMQRARADSSHSLSDKSTSNDSQTTFSHMKPKIRRRMPLSRTASFKRFPRHAKFHALANSTFDSTTNVTIEIRISPAPSEHSFIL